MRYSIVTFHLILITGFSYSQDFRNVYWGMGVNDVKRNENFILYENESNSENEYILTYKGVIFEDSVTLEYRFLFDSLVIASYKIKTENTKVKSILPIYMDYLNHLTKKYGESKSYGWIWNDQDERLKYENYLKVWPKRYNGVFLDLYNNKLLDNIFYEWHTDNTQIVLTFIEYLHNTNNTSKSQLRIPTIYIFYYANNLERLYNLLNKKQINKNL